LTNVAIKKVNVLFTEIDRIRNKEITFATPLVVAILGVYLVYLALGLY
jgi:cbb3-type cytochrome oxidase subunit 3